MKTLIKNGELVSGAGVRTADILIENGLIADVGRDIPLGDAELIDAKGLQVFPGFIDTHTHFDMEAGGVVTADDFATGTLAAIAGGTTTILDFATQDRGKTLKEALNTWHAKAKGKCSCDYGFHMAITEWNDSVAGELAYMSGEGVTSYKLYMAYDALRVRDADIFRVLRAVSLQGGIVGVHCENGDLVDVLIAEQLIKGNTSPAAHPLSRPDIVEAEAVNRMLTIAKLAGCPVNIVHLSSKAGLELVMKARLGQPVYVETCPQYLLLDDSNYSKEGFEGAKYAISPPLRKKDDMEALWEAAVRGSVDTIGTDHCSFNFTGQKDRGVNDFSKTPNGAPGVQNRPQLMYTYGVDRGRIPPSMFCSLLSENPAKLFGLYPKKGALLPGSDADIVLWDPEYSGVISRDNQYSACDYTPYEGFAVKGRPARVLLRGKEAVRDGAPVNEGLGEYVQRGACQFWR